jgi:hypothetical protein
MMSPAELEALTEDIAQNGMRQPIVRYEGKVLDGRNRLLACEKAGVEPTFTDHEGDEASALALVESLNVERRDLTPAQRALAAARRWGLDGYSKPGPKRSPETPAISLRSLAKKYKVTDKPIMQARDLLARAADLVERVDSGALTLAAAHEELHKRSKQAAEDARNSDICQYRLKTRRTAHLPFRGRPRGRFGAGGAAALRGRPRRPGSMSGRVTGLVNASQETPRAAARTCTVPQVGSRLPSSRFDSAWRLRPERLASSY